MRHGIGRAALAAVGAVTSGAGASALAATQKTPVVCAGTDRVLRLQPSGRCAAGETPVTIGGASASGGGSPQNASTDQRVAALEQQINRLTHRVTAPFEVDDANGVPILVVDAVPRGLRVMTTAGQVVATVAANPDGGYFRGSDPAQAWTATMGVKANTPQMLVKKGNIALGAFTIAGGKPSLEIINDAGISVVSLTTGSSGGGTLQMTDPSGTPTVSAGTLPDHRGTVRVGPQFNCAAKAFVVPDCIVGHQ